MAIEDRTKVVAGVTLEARHKGVIHKAVVGANADGELTFTVGDKTFNSTSKAGSHVADGTSVNGWRFWSLEGQLAEPRKPSEPKAKAEKVAKEPKGKAAPKPKTGKIITKQRKQPEGQAEGVTTFFCSACMAPFEAPSGETPTACPQGHGEAVATPTETSEAPVEEAPAEPVTLDL